MLLGAETARVNGFAVGERLDLHPSWVTDTPALAAVVVGLIEANDLDARYWSGLPGLLDAQTASWPTYMLFVSQDVFFGAPRWRCLR